MIRGIAKSSLPNAAWNYGRNKYNWLRYSLLWFSRKRVCFEKKGSTISLAIVDATDPIQAVQSSGKFYEERDLDAIAPYFQRGGTFVDIGANTGQHSIYFAKLLGASEAILFEPISETCKILRENIKLNDLGAICDLAFLGLGLTDRPGRADFSIKTYNLGGTTLHESAAGAIRTITGDFALAGRKVDFIKIDTEGFEMKVLRGLTQTIKENRPTIYIEVDERNSRAFQEFLLDAHYAVEMQHKRYDENENFLICPEERRDR